MAWPKLEKVSCHGFTRSLLPAIKIAIDAGTIEWNRKTIQYGARFVKGQFHWCYCTWEMQEANDYIISIRFIDGLLDNEDLTAAVLRAII